MRILWGISARTRGVIIDNERFLIGEGWMFCLFFIGGLDVLRLTELCFQSVE